MSKSWEEQVESGASLDFCGNSLSYNDTDGLRGDKGHQVVYVHARWVKEAQKRATDPSHSLRARLEAFSRDCVTHGDMTPAAARMLTRILEETR